jgi:glycerol-3-phosphate acyltransferase PlsY
MIEILGLIEWRSAAPYLAATFLCGYLLGSIPFGLFFARLAGAGDVRTIGSGNIGATNVLRTGKRWAAFATFLADAAKGAVAVIVAGHYFGIQIFPVAAGLGAIIGHCYPVWLKFRGGKGVSTFIGITFGLAWPVALLVCASWLTVARIFRFSSLAALISAAAAPLYFLLIGTTLFAAFALVLAVLIFFTHRANIVRLFKGTEPRIGAR